MKQRALIKSQIIKAWHKSISRDYCNQRINSERSLQASFWSHLNCQLSKNRRIFIEPCMSIHTDSGVKKLIPDIVICNSKKVIAIVELKYSPRGQPKFQKDIKNLSLIAINRHQISIANDRFRGKETDSNKYTLANNILFVWAGVHAKEVSLATELFSSDDIALHGCYLELHAITENNSKPVIIQRQ